MVDNETSVEIDKLKKRYKDLGESIEGFLSAMSRGSTTTDKVLSSELTRVRMEMASIARRLKGLGGPGD